MRSCLPIVIIALAIGCAHQPTKKKKGSNSSSTFNSKLDYSFATQKDSESSLYIEGLRYRHSKTFENPAQVSKEDKPKRKAVRRIQKLPY